MTYEEFIRNILNSRGQFACGDEYCERHHITPRCMDGTDDEENLIDLFAREHFEAHRLLALENPNNDKLIYAWHMMSIMNDNYNRAYEITAEEYEEARKAFVNVLSLNMSGENNIMYGKCHSEETRQKIGEKAKIRYENQNNHPMFGRNHNEETKRVISDKAKERYKNPEDNPMYGRNHTEESKEKMGVAKRGKSIGPLTEDHKRRIGESNKGKVRSEEFCKKQSDSFKELFKDSKNHPSYGKGKYVIQLSISEKYVSEYVSATEAQKITGINAVSIRRCCKHKKGHKTAGGFIWMYKEEYNLLINDCKGEI